MLPIEIILSVGFILSKFRSLYIKVHAINHVCNKLHYITWGEKKKKKSRGQGGETSNGARLQAQERRGEGGSVAGGEAVQPEVGNGTNSSLSAAKLRTLL